MLLKGLLYLLHRVIKRLYKATNFVVRFFINFTPEIIVGLIAGFISSLFYQLGIGDPLHIMIIGGILPFVPGVSITNSVRDAINGDLISATSRGMEALLIAISLAIGVTISLGVFI